MNTHATPLARRHIIPIAGVMAELDVSRSKVYNLINERKLERVNIGSRAYITAESYDRFLAGLCDAARRRGPRNAE
jgi:hypothetical protein